MKETHRLSGGFSLNHLLVFTIIIRKPMSMPTFTPVKKSGKRSINAWLTPETTANGSGLVRNAQNQTMTAVKLNYGKHLITILAH